MKIYAVISNEIVSNIILLEEGSNYPITNNMVDITNSDPMPEIGFSYENGFFVAPAPIILSTDELAEQSSTQAESYILSNFTALQLLSIFQLLLQGNTTQKGMCQEILNWTNAIVQEALTHASNPNFDQFTPPKYTYLQIVRAT